MAHLKAVGVPEGPWIEETPDWICEILSPSTRDHDLHVKLPAYARHGVSFAWIVDPSEHSLQTLARKDGDWESLEAGRGNVTVSTAPFDELPVELQSLWL